MAERRQPDYDFFGPGQGPQQQPYGAPPQQPYGGPPQRPTFAPPPAPYDRTGPPPAGYVVPRRSRAVTALIVAAVVVAGVIGLGIVSAVAIPVFLSQRMRAEWKATTVSLPETFEGGQRISAPADLQPQTPEGMARVDVGNYRTDAGVTLFVVAAKTGDPLTAEDQADARRSLLAGLASEGMVLRETDAGALGGWFGCGIVAGSPSTACVATDHGSLVAVIVAGSDDPAAEARRMREAVVKH
jgi:hypothetical protein